MEIIIFDEPTMYAYSSKLAWTVYHKLKSMGLKPIMVRSSKELLNKLKELENKTSHKKENGNK